jgi:hypothetical protein
MVTMFVHYRPSLFFGLLSAVNLAGAVFLGLRFLYLVYFTPVSTEHRTYIPSLILLAVLAIFGAGLAALAVIAELQRANRKLMEEMLYQQRRRAGNDPAA